MVKDHKVFGPGKLGWVLVVALGGCQPCKVGSQNGVAAKDAMADGWCIGGTSRCSGQDQKNTGHAFRGMHRELLLLPDLGQGVEPVEGVGGPEVIGSAGMVEHHLLHHGQSGLCHVSCRVFQ